MPGYITAAFSDPATGFTIAVVLNDSTAGSGMGAYLAWELAAIASWCADSGVRLISDEVYHGLVYPGAPPTSCAWTC